MMKGLPDMKKEEKINMCQAMEEWYADAVKEGVQKDVRRAGCRPKKEKNGDYYKNAGRRACPR